MKRKAHIKIEIKEPDYFQYIEEKTIPIVNFDDNKSLAPLFFDGSSGFADRKVLKFKAKMIVDIMLKRGLYYKLMKSKMDKKEQYGQDTKIILLPEEMHFYWIKFLDIDSALNLLSVNKTFFLLVKNGLTILPSQIDDFIYRTDSLIPGALWRNLIVEHRTGHFHKIDIAIQIFCSVVALFFLALWTKCKDIPLAGPICLAGAGFVAICGCVPKLMCCLAEKQNNKRNQRQARLQGFKENIELSFFSRPPSPRVDNKGRHFQPTLD